MRPSLPAAFVAVVLAALAPCRAGLAAPTYNFVNFDVPGARPGLTFAYGINNAGQVVGSYYDSVGSPQGFLRNADGTYVTLSNPLATFGTQAQGINANGQIVGEYASGALGSGVNGFGFLLDQASGSYTTLSVAGATRGTSAQGINNTGTVVGYSTVGASDTQGFLFDPASGSYTTFANPAASLVRPGDSTLHETVPYGINDAGQVVGRYVGADGGNGFLRGTDGSYTKLQDPVGTGSTAAYGINNVGQVVGWYFSCCGGSLSPDGFQGFVLDLASGTYTTIRDPASTDTRFSGGMTYAYGINDAGQIVGTYEDSSVGLRGFIATPQTAAVPEPASLLLLGAGVVGLAIARRWRPR